MPKASAGKNFFASPQEAEAAYYEAVQNGDIETLMGVWAEEDDIVYVNPAGMRFVGHAAIREAWLKIFADGMRLSVRHAVVGSNHTPFAAVHSVIEEVGLQGAELQRAPVLTSNVYMRGALGWRLVAQHASPANPNLPAAAPTVLH